MNRLTALVIAGVSLAMTVVAPGTSLAADFEAGLAVIDITPPRPYRMSGYFNERLSTGTHDPLQAKALVLRQGPVRGALVFCDLIGMNPAVTAQARKEVAAKTGIPADAILIHATHTHTGPLYEGALRKYFHDVAIAKEGRDRYEEPEYSEFLVGRLVEVITQAHGKLRAASLSAGVATQRGLAFNRRFHMRDGTVRFNPGKLNPQIIRPAGPVDTDLGLVLFKSADGKEVASLATFPLHLDTVGGTEFGADYPFHLDRALRAKLGADFVSLFGTGTCGDINHVDVTHSQPQKGDTEASRIGTALAQTVLAALPELKPLANPALAIRSGTVTVSLQQYPPEETEQARKDLFRVGSQAIPFLDQVKAVKLVELQLYGGKTLTIEVQVFRLSDDAAIVGLPGEVFVELGLEIKRRSPFAHTLVIELCNDSPCYIPTKKAFEEGSYETVNSLAAPGGGEAMVDLAVKLLEESKTAR